MFGRHKFHLSKPHAMLAGDGSTHRQSPPNETLVQLFRFLKRFWIAGIGQDEQVEIAIAYMTDDGRS